MQQVKSNEKMTINTKVNDKSYEVDVEPRKLLSDFLREDLGLTGTHVGCEHGVCGACTIMIDGHAIRSCLMFAVQIDGSEVETIEGLQKKELGLELKEAFSKHHALQCGFCTAGILMSAVEFLYEENHPTEKETREMLSGHLCRCTGYEGIVSAIQEVAEKNNEGR
ncbi:(2Fe-2S)-binding protein [Salinicoccus halodurans]|uniref:2-furoyl-CoA dehydrogenase 2Fe-2S iron sulfur subunit n=2 Tax=Salinicoccus halodurans TaxID=407035 RepID=A0AA94HCB0_9STAP|nr:(2Fe-2S)-binding protein [Salinicoccus halodurans]SFK52343.1 2-furoyl-CoA dehydrogenase 2Fe-2S iron sulfur subunit [Salinicoccus halodurans]